MDWMRVSRLVGAYPQINNAIEIVRIMILSRIRSLRDISSCYDGTGSSIGNNSPGISPGKVA